MDSVNVVSHKMFVDRFREVIRVGLNWERFELEDWPVEVVTVRQPDDLNRFFMPWYIGAQGTEVAYDDPDAVPMKLTDVAKAIEILNSERQGDIMKYVDDFRTQPGPIEFTVPTYGMPDDKYFVLDRNHRLSALALHAVPFLVTLWNIRGPMESECLLDLSHWTKKNDD